MDLKEQYFGTEIEMTGITREEAANAVGELFGTQPYYIGTSTVLGESEIWKEKSGSLPTMGASIHSEEMETVMFMQIVSTAQKWSVRNWNMAKWKNCNRLCAV